MARGKGNSPTDSNRAFRGGGGEKDLLWLILCSDFLSDPVSTFTQLLSSADYVFQLSKLCLEGFVLWFVPSFEQSVCVESVRR